MFFCLSLLRPLLAPVALAVIIAFPSMDNRSIRIVSVEFPGGKNQQTSATSDGQALATWARVSSLFITFKAERNQALFLLADLLSVVSSWTIGSRRGHENRSNLIGAKLIYLRRTKDGWTLEASLDTTSKPPRLAPFTCWYGHLLSTCPLAWSPRRIAMTGPHLYKPHTLLATQRP